MNGISLNLPRVGGSIDGSGGLSGSALRLMGALLLLLLSAACTTVGAPYAPESSFTTRSDIDALKKKFASDTSITAYYNGADNEQRRNEFIAGRLVLYDLAYVDWVSRFRFGRAAESTILDTATLGVNQATALFGGARTKEVLGAIAGAIVGTRSSYEKNFYDEQAAGAITAQMNAERRAALIPILAGTTATIEEYPLTVALVDLATYQYAGTIDGALAGIHREAGIKENKANAVIADLEQYRTVVYAPDASSDRIRAWLYPGFVRYNDDGRPVDKDGEPIRNDAQRKMLMDELDRLGLGGLPIATFLTSGTLGAERAKVITRLQIP
jgi:hypothetical protein